MEGGTSALLNNLFTSQLQSYSDIAPHLRFIPPTAPVSAQVASSLIRYGANTMFKSLFTAFLSTTGIPSKPHFDAVRDHFSGAVDLHSIDKGAFRPQLLCWAATGSPSMDIGSCGIAVCGF